MFFNPQLAQSREITTVPGQVGVAISKPGHERPAFPVEESDFGILL
jgi:hypothetical protein